MLKLFRSGCIVSAVMMLGCVACAVMFGFRGDADIEKLLASKSAVEMFRTSNKSGQSTGPEVSALMKMGISFANRIDPPPPPKPVKKESRVATTVAKTQTEVTEVAPPISIQVRYKVLATCVYPDVPEKSMALISLPASETKWYRAGDHIEYSDIKEVKQDCIIIVRKGNSAEQRVDIQEEKDGPKSLLASDKGSANAYQPRIGPGKSSPGTPKRPSSSTSARTAPSTSARTASSSRSARTPSPTVTSSRPGVSTSSPILSQPNRTTINRTESTNRRLPSRSTAAQSARAKRVEAAKAKKRMADEKKAAEKAKLDEWEEMMKE